MPPNPHPSLAIPEDPTQPGRNEQPTRLTQTTQAHIAPPSSQPEAPHPHAADNSPSLGKLVKYYYPVRLRPSPAIPVQYPQIAPHYPNQAMQSPQPVQPSPSLAMSQNVCWWRCPSMM